jgi:hypothetical protein
VIDLIIDAWETLFQPSGQRRWVRVLVTLLLVAALVATIVIVAQQM